MKKLTKRLLFIIGAVILMTTLGACGNQSLTAATNKLNVVATTNFYGEIAHEVLGNHGRVTSIINSPNVDPHDFTPTTATAKKVAKAELVVENGIGYDSWINRLQPRRTLSVGKLCGAHNGDNEHLWYNTDNIRKYVDALTQQASQLMPKDASIFKQNARKYKQKLLKLDNKMHLISTKRTNSKVAVSEPVFDYALQKMGFKVIDNHFALAIEEGSDPSYTDIRDLQNDIKNHRIAFFVLNKQDESKVVDNIVQLCHMHHVPVLKVTETMPTDATYISWFNDELDQLAQIMQSKR